MTIVIEGPCLAGKTTYANKLAAELSVSCNVFHMDDFFLRPRQRTDERFNTPGGNVDYERFLSEVILPLKENKAFSYRKFDCKTMSLGEEVYVKPAEINIVEGTYSMHPELGKYYDKSIYIDILPEKQLERLKNRENEEKVKMFIQKWIPLEQAYFAFFEPKNKCDEVIFSDD